MDEPFVLTLLSRDPDWVRAADEAGVQRIGIDIERLGKVERQGRYRGARISDHELEDLRGMRSMVRQALLFARLNPPHAGTRDEVEKALDLGARSLMLPWFHAAEEAARFVDLVRGRAEVVLLLETCDAMSNLGEILRIPGIGEIMIGLNDLRLELRLAHPMELAASPLMSTMAQQIKSAGHRFGFGGVARPDDVGLLLPPDWLLARYAQLGAHSAWLSRSFFRGGLKPEDLPSALQKLRRRLDFWFTRPTEELAAVHDKFAAMAASWAAPSMSHGG